MQKYKTFLSIFVLFIIINMILQPQVYIQASLNGISAWAFHVLPSVLPFIFFTKILNSLGTIERFTNKIKAPSNLLFKTPPISSYVFLTSAVSGYPIGAKMTADLYQQGKIKKEDAFKMCSFCSTSGPMFIVGAVGVGLLKSAFCGYIILIAHILGALLNGILYRNLKVKNTSETISPTLNHLNSKKDLSSIITDSTLSILSVGTIIAVFFVIITALSPILAIFPAKTASILEGLVEITKGCTSIASISNGIWGIVACTFIISFGGISTILQSITMLNQLNMPVKLFILQKLTHAILATFICLLIVLFI